MVVERYRGFLIEENDRPAQKGTFVYYAGGANVVRSLEDARKGIDDYIERLRNRNPTDFQERAFTDRHKLGRVK